MRTIFVLHFTNTHALYLIKTKIFFQSFALLACNVCKNSSKENGTLKSHYYYTYITEMLKALDNSPLKTLGVGFQALFLERDIEIKYKMDTWRGAGMFNSVLLEKSGIKPRYSFKQHEPPKLNRI